MTLRKSRTAAIAVAVREVRSGDYVRTNSGRVLEVHRAVRERDAVRLEWATGERPTTVPTRYAIAVLRELT